MTKSRQMQRGGNGLETDIMRMQREAERRVRELRERERRIAHPEDERGRTAEGLAENRTEWMHAAGFQPLSEYKARNTPRQTQAPRPHPEPVRETKALPEKRGDGGLLSLFGNDQEQLFLLLLAFLLVKNGAKVELIIALLYLAM